MAAPSALPSIDDFRPLVAELFSIGSPASAPVSARLSEVTSLGWNTPRDRGGRESFSLLFHAPADCRLPQGIHTFTHPQVGTHDLFTVPLGSDGSGMRLQVVFNFV